MENGNGGAFKLIYRCWAFEITNFEKSDARLPKEII